MLTGVYTLYRVFHKRIKQIANDIKDLQVGTVNALCSGMNKMDNMTKISFDLWIYTNLIELRARYNDYRLSVEDFTTERMDFDEYCLELFKYKVI